MPFKSEKQRRYLHANHPDIAKRWEEEYSGGGIARMGYAYGDLVDDMMTQRTPLGNELAFNPGSPLDNQIKKLNRLEELGVPQPNLQNLKDMDMKQFKEKGIPLSLPEDRYVDSEMFGTDATYTPQNTAADIAANFYQFDDVESQDPGMFEEKDEDVNFINRMRNINAMRKYAMPAYNFIKGNMGAGLMGLVNPIAGLATLARGRNLKDSAAYRPATQGAYGYSPAQLNSMNALGGYYSEPARQQRRMDARRINILNRAAKGKAVGNVNNLLGEHGYKGTPDGGIEFTGRSEGSSTAGAGYSRSDDSWSSSPFKKGGLASLWQR
jgi:hypothetical protein